MTLKGLWQKAVNKAHDDSYRLARVGRHNPDMSVDFSVGGRKDYLWVTLADQTTVQARNDAGVPQTIDLEVWVRAETNAGGGPPTHVIEGRSAAGLLSAPGTTPPSGVLAHATTHQHGGTDEVATATPAANAIPKADGAGLLDAWVTHTDVGAAINAATADTPLDADKWAFWDVVDGVLKSVTWANIKATLKTYFDTLYTAINTAVLLAGNQTVAGEKTFTNHVAVDGDSETSFNTVLGGAALSRWIDSVNRPILALRKYRGARASPTAVQSGDLLGDLGFQGYDGSNLQQGGMLHATVDGAPSAGSVPTRVSITTGSSSGSRAENLTVKANGRIGFNGVTDPQGALHADQSSTTAAVPVLILDQADLSEEMIEFDTTVGTGNPIDTAALGTYYGKVRVSVNGTFKYIALYNS